MVLLSIVIPTRDREYYCISAIKEILAYERNDFELVICDNSDSDEIKKYLINNPDTRTKYKHIGGRINSVINMDTAMRMATGEYVCMIGDDDTILPSIFKVAELAKANNYDNVTPNKMVSYIWPKPGENNGVLSWSTTAINCEIKTYKCEEQLQKFVRNGVINYEDFIPRVYHGLVKRSLLEKVFEKTGHMIGGLSPDIYMSISTACVSESFVVIEKPFTIAGACPRSYTAVDSQGGNRGNIEENPQLYKRGAYIWDKRIPRVLTSQTIWTETAMKAFEEMDRHDLITHFNQGYLFAEMLRKNQSFAKILFSPIFKTTLVSSRLCVIYSFISYYVVKSIKKIFRKKTLTVSVNNIEDMDVAVERYNEYKKV